MYDILMYSDGRCNRELPQNKCSNRFPRKEMALYAILQLIKQIVIIEKVCLNKEIIMIIVYGCSE